MKAVINGRIIALRCLHIRRAQVQQTGKWCHESEESEVTKDVRYQEWRIALDCSEIQAVKGYLRYKKNCDGGGNAAYFFALTPRRSAETE